MSGGRLPPRLDAMIDEVVARAGLRGPTARHVRADLEQHVRDGLAAGRTEEELVARFGDPEAVAPLLVGTPGPPAPHRTGGPGDGFLRGLAADLRFGLRVLVRNPTLSLTAAVVLALGIGANTVVFTVVNELLLRPLPVREPETLVDVWPDIPGGNSFLGFAWEDFRTYRESADVLDELALFAGLRVTLGDDGAGQELIGQLVSPEYFPMLGLAPSLGRMAFPPDGAFGEDATAVLSHAFWKESFGADPGVVGRTVRLDGHPVTVQGVGPEGFTGHFIGF
ncbi:MAG TPA: ABC transporter permease, partial [Longimicrobiales bacterium]|nr:ABC transporter permease [Longimicrobiales bacterium]